MKKIQNYNRLKLAHFAYKNASRQQGVVLIWAVVFLLVITIIGLSAVRMTGIDTQVSGNSMLTMLTFQGAESTFGKTATQGDIFYLERAAEIPSVLVTVDPQHLPAEKVSGGTLFANGDVKFDALYTECPISNTANSTYFGCTVYRMNARSQLKGTGAKANHTQAVALLKPPIE